MKQLVTTCYSFLRVTYHLDTESLLIPPGSLAVVRRTLMHSGLLTWLDSASGADWWVRVGGVVKS